MAQTIRLFNVEIEGIKKNITNLNELQKAVRSVTKQLKKQDVGSKQYKDLNKTLAQLKAVQATARKSTRELSKEFQRGKKSLAEHKAEQKKSREETKRQMLAIKAQEKSYDGLKAKIKLLKKQYQELRSSEGETTEESKRLLKQINSLEGELKQIDGELKRGGKSLAEHKKAQRDSREETKRQRLELEAQENSYRGLSARLSLMKKRYKDMAARNEESTKEAKDLRKEIGRLDGRMKKIDKSVGENFRNVGNYQSAMKGLGSTMKRVGKQMLTAFGIVGAMDMFSRVVRDAVKTVTEFDSATAKLAALTGQTREEISALTENAQQLGATTAFSATQVQKLQIELAKLGFTQDQIKALSKSVINMSIAMDTDAASAAELAGAAVRSFGLQAKDAERVAAVLAVSTTKSALSFEKLQTALPKVAPVAAAMNFEIEDTVALLGELANAGFDASTAATSTRNIFLKMVDPAGELAKALGGPVQSFDEMIPALKELQKELGEDGLAKSLELTGKRSVAAFQRFLDGADNARELRDSLIDVNEELSIMAEKQLDTLEGKVRLLSSAWDGLTLSVDKGEGALSNFFKTGVEEVTDFLTVLRQWNEGNVSFGEMFRTAFQDPTDIGFGVGELTGVTEARNAWASLAVSGSMEGLVKNTNEVVSSIADLREELDSIQMMESIHPEELIKRQNEIAKNVSNLIDNYNAYTKLLLRTDLTEQQRSEALKRRSELEVILGNAIQEGHTDKLKALNQQLSFYKARLGAVNQLGLEGSNRHEKLKEKIEDLNKEISKFGKDPESPGDPTPEGPTPGSLEALKKQISATKKSIEQSGDETFVQIQLRLLTRLEEKLSDLEEKYDQFKSTAGDAVDPLSTRSLPGVGVDEDLQASDIQVEDTITTRLEMETEMYRRLSELRRSDFESEQEYQDARQRITLQAQRKIKQAMLNTAEEGSKEWFKLKDEINAIDAELIKLAETTSGVGDVMKQIGQELKREWSNIMRDLLSAQMERESTTIERIKDDRIDALEEEYQRRIELAEGNVEEQARLKSNLERKKEEIEKQAFEKQKQLSKKQAIINGAIAATNALATVQPFIPAGIAAAALAAVKTAAEIAVIEAQSYPGRQGLSISKDFVRQMGQGGAIQIGEQQGKTHSEGGIKGTVHGLPVEIERGEWGDFDEEGAFNVINKASTSKHRSTLEATKGKIFPGKRNLMESINRDLNGRAYGQQGLSVRPNGLIESKAAGGLQLSDGDIEKLARAIGQNAYEGTRDGNEDSLRRAERQRVEPNER